MTQVPTAHTERLGWTSIDFGKLRYCLVQIPRCGLRDASRPSSLAHRGAKESFNRCRGTKDLPVGNQNMPGVFGSRSSDSRYERILGLGAIRHRQSLVCLLK